MIKRILLFVILSVSNTFAADINVVSINIIDETLWNSLKQLFVNTFSEAYKQVDIKDIAKNCTSTVSYLHDLFDFDRKSIQNLNFDIVLITENQELLGYVLCCYLSDSKTVYIHHLVVDSSRHNKGIGKKLISACENFYSEAKYHALSTRRFNLKAIGFYKHVGFYETDNAPEIAYVIRPTAKNNSQIVNLKKVINAR